MRKIKRNYGGIDYIIREDGQIFTTLNKNRKTHLKQCITKDGYAQICLGSCKNEQVGKKSYLVHRLVAEAFNENPHNLPEVDHKDGNKLNNHASNLEWVTREENMKRSYDNGTHNRQGMNHPKARLSYSDVFEIRRLYDNHIMSTREIAVKYGMSYYTIWDIVKRRSWKHILTSLSQSV